MANSKYEHIGRPETRVVEECAELIHILQKVDRFGWFNYHPDDPAKTSNMELVRREMNDVLKAIGQLEKYMQEIRACKNYLREMRKEGLK